MILKWRHVVQEMNTKKKVNMWILAFPANQGDKLELNT